MRPKRIILAGLFALMIFQSMPLCAHASKCFFIASYHRGYEWQDRLEKSLRQTLGNQCDLLQFNMDTKRNRAPEFCRQKADEARQIIQAWKPDVLIVSDDNASKYLIAPFYKNSAIPVVFCGINLPAAEYGYPYENATGMIEVSPVKPLIGYIRKILPEKKTVTFLFPSHLSSRKAAIRFREIFRKEGFLFSLSTTDTMDEFEQAYQKAQNADLILFGNCSSLSGWDDQRVRNFLLKNSKKLTVTMIQSMMPYTMLGVTTVPEEQGEYAAMTALKILEGAKPSDIPVVGNRKWNIFVNNPILDAAGIDLPDEIIQKAQEINR